MNPIYVETEPPTRFKLQRVKQPHCIPWATSRLLDVIDVINKRGPIAVQYFDFLGIWTIVCPSVDRAHIVRAVPAVARGPLRYSLFW